MTTQLEPAIPACANAVIRRPINVTHVVTSFDAAGAELMLARLVRNMDSSAFKNSVIGLGPDGPVAEQIRAGGICVTTLNIRGPRLVSGFYRLIAHLRRQQPDVIQTWMYRADLLGGLGSLAVPGARLAWNIRCGGLDGSACKRSTLWACRVCAKLSRVLPDRIAACSTASLAAHVAGGYSTKNTEVIPNGFDTEEFRPQPRLQTSLRRELGVSDSALLIGLIARYDPVKDHATFCRAAAGVSRSHPEAHFVLCGNQITPQNSSLMAVVNAAGIAEKTHLLGARRDIAAITAALDIAISCSITEAFSNTIGEAMACGVPCVATNTGDSAQIIGDTGRVVPVRSPQALADAICELIRLGTRGRAEHGMRARQRIVEQFPLAKTVRQYERLYRDLVTPCAA